jgi:hypothetical protein
VTAADPKLFISYRREESAVHAGRLYDAIAARFGDRNVFMDVDMAPGVDFVARITEAVADCDVLLVVIGRDGPRSRTTGGDRASATPATTCGSNWRPRSGIPRSP